MTAQALVSRAAAPALDTAQVERFAELGYVVLPGFLPDDLVARLQPEVDRWVDGGLRSGSIAACLDPEGHRATPALELEMPAHGELIAHPPLMEVLARLMGRAFAFHHLHSDRQAPGLAGKDWHHDYEQRPQTDRAYTMIHTLHYLNGLDDKTSSLVVLPGSHREVAEKTARAHLGTERLPGEVVIDRLPRGSTVVLHSALFHARRRRPERTGKARYFVDASYCQAGTRWPQVKPYWRYMLRRARELELHRGEWPELFAERHFAEFVRSA
jgi:hypothetical protein